MFSFGWCFREKTQTHTRIAFFSKKSPSTDTNQPKKRTRARRQQVDGAARGRRQHVVRRVGVPREAEHLGGGVCGGGGCGVVFSLLLLLLLVGGGGGGGRPEAPDAEAVAAFHLVWVGGG